MADENALEDLMTELLIRCDNEKCRKLIGESELQQNNGKCPYCGQQIQEET